MALTDNLISYYNLDSNANDSVGGINGTVTTPANVAAKISNGYDFNGSSDSITFAANWLTSGDWTISCWINPDDVTQFGVIVVDRPTTAGPGVIISAETINARWWTGTGNNIRMGVTGNILSASTWQHIVVTYTSGTNTLLVYYNGSAVGTTNSNNTSGITGRSFGNGAGNYYKGILDEVGIWSRALDSSEVSTLYNSGSGLTYPFAAGGTNFQINIGDSWKEIAGIQINIGDSWKSVAGAQINIGDSWKTIF